MMAITTVKARRQVTLPKNAERIGLVEGAPLRFDVNEDEGTLTIRVLQLGSDPSLTREDLADLQAAVQEALAVPDEGTGIVYESIDDAHADRRGRLVTLA